LAVGGPLPGLHQSEFFLINPAKAPVIKIFFTAVGQPGLLVSSYVIYKKIALTLITDLRTIRRQLSRACIVGQERKRLIFDRVEIIVRDTRAAIYRSEIRLENQEIGRASCRERG